MGTPFLSSAESLKRGQQDHGGGGQSDDGASYHARVAPSAPVLPRQSHTQDGRAEVPAGQAFARRLCHASLMATKPRDPLELAGLRKDLIEMERRHIREGEARIARQEEIVSQLESSAGHESENTLTAHALLVAFHKFLALAKQHLDNLERKHPGGPPESN
jgi:hypothetical protein